MSSDYKELSSIEDSADHDNGLGYKKINIRNKKTCRPNQVLVCNYCTKFYTKSQNMQAHIRMHRNYKPFQCRNCNK